jgi:hypothetical protein
VHERLRVRVPERGPLAPDPFLQKPRDDVGGESRHPNAGEHAGSAPVNGERGGEREPDDSKGAGERKGLEERVERLAAMKDDPALELVIEAGQVRGVRTSARSAGLGDGDGDRDGRRRAHGCQGEWLQRPLERPCTARARPLVERTSE